MWGGEFGRTPVAQGKDGRDHNPEGFTMWLAGGGVSGGMQVWGNRRIRLLRRREQNAYPRSPRDAALSAGSRPSAADLSLRRP